MQDFYVEKVCNAFIPSAAPSDIVGGAARGAVNRFSNKHGGLWVGGKITLSVQEISFAPNRLNAALHDGPIEVRIPMAQVRSVRREFGWFTGIVCVALHDGEFRFRCYGAQRVADTLQAHIPAV